MLEQSGVEQRIRQIVKKGQKGHKVHKGKINYRLENRLKWDAECIMNIFP